MTVYSLAGFSARRRAPQRQQQPERVLLNRQQQQQGTTEFQRGQPVGGQERPMAAQPVQAARHSEGGTPMRLSERSAGTARELKCYVRESSVNVDA
jgi:hypothetical protein